MKYTKRLLTSLVVFITFFALLENVNAMQTDADHINLNDEYSFVPSDAEQFIENCGWEKPTPDAKLVKVARVPHQSVNGYNNILETNPVNPSWWGNGLYVKKVGGESPACGTTVRARTSGVGGAQGRLTLEQTVTVSNTFSTNVDVSVLIISTGVGYDVTRTRQAKASYQVETRGKNYVIEAYDDYQLQNFEVWDNPFFGSEKRVGSGYSGRQVGFCFAVWEIR